MRKLSRQLGHLRRKLRNFINDIRKLSYLTLVRPQLSLVYLNFNVPVHETVSRPCHMWITCIWELVLLPIRDYKLFILFHFNWYWLLFSISSYRVGRLRGGRRRRKTTESTMRPKSAMRAVSMCGRRGESLARKRQWRTSAPIEEGKLCRMDTAIKSCGRIESKGIERELPLSWNALRRQVVAYELMIVRKFRFWFLARAVFLRPSLFFLSCFFLSLQPVSGLHFWMANVRIFFIMRIHETARIIHEPSL